MELKSMKVSHQDGVAEVALSGPAKGNPMGPDFWRELPQVFDGLNADDATRAVLLRADGPHFTYGLDLMSMMGDVAPLMVAGTTARERTQLLAMIHRLQDAVQAVVRCRKPVVAAVNGWCIGGGLDLVAACDVRLCSEDARFSLREVRVGMVADLGSLQRLPFIIGEGNTRELAFTGKDIDAARALQMGLVGQVHASTDGLLEAARAMVKQMADNPPLVVQGIKQVMNASQGRPPSDGLAQVAVWNTAFLPSLDLAEAVGAFAERRPPRFTGA